MFLTRLAIIFLLTLSLAFVIGKCFDTRYKKRWQGLFFDKIETALSPEKEYDILLLGNSRLHSGINPWYIDSITHLTSYNLGLGAADEQEIKLISTLYLQNHRPPKIAIFGMDNMMLIKYNVLKERFAYLFFLNNDTVKAYMKENGFQTTLIKYFPFTKYSFFDEYNRTSIFINGSKIPESKYGFYKGFINMFPDAAPGSFGTGVKTNSVFRDTLPKAEKINDTSAVAIRQTVEMFIKKGVHVIFLFLPAKNTIRKTDDPVSPFKSFFLSLAAEYKIPVIRSDTSSAYLEKYFMDNIHLNQPGAKLLSLQVGNFIVMKYPGQNNRK